VLICLFPHAFRFSCHESKALMVQKNPDWASFVILNSQDGMLDTFVKLDVTFFHTTGRKIMSLIRRTLLTLSTITAVAVAPVYADQSDDGVKRLALQISDKDPATFNKTLNVATNFAKRTRVFPSRSA